ncbi:hypothetical protein ACLB2K_064236 [Fragaria x ananassa]
MPFKFGSRRFPVKLNVKYDRTMSFCRVCGLLVHSESWCAGKPNLLPQFIEIESMRTPFGFGGAARVSGNPNPNLEVQPRLFAQQTNLQVDRSGGPSTLPKLSFSIPGISAADLALKLDRLRTPPVLQSTPIAVSAVIVETPQGNEVEEMRIQSLWLWCLMCWTSHQRWL